MKKKKRLPGEYIFWGEFRVKVSLEAISLSSPCSNHILRICSAIKNRRHLTGNAYDTCPQINFVYGSLKII